MGDFKISLWNILIKIETQLISGEFRWQYRMQVEISLQRKEVTLRHIKLKNLLLCYFQSYANDVVHPGIKHYIGCVLKVNWSLHNILKGCHAASHFGPIFFLSEGMVTLKAHTKGLKHIQLKNKWRFHL